MAKGLRCKTKRAFRAVKRQHVSATVEATRMETLQQRLLMIQRGEDPMAFSRRPLNKFLYPDAADAVFPQKTPGARPLDFRSEALPLAGMVGWGQRKKYTEEEKIELVSLFNCLPGRTEGPEVQGAQSLRRAEAGSEKRRETAESCKAQGCVLTAPELPVKAAALRKGSRKRQDELDDNRLATLYLHSVPA
ncbi:hypothetical protein cyc_01090 [Cyclospora cayetanensis]|uniref:DUF2423 domain-containing protein n=1 Tax=Cyclospora cayetanensis TaxID=88456 RepID=A0A1D3D3A4_9EIME|nr:hypothetical protein cyc_01090 [Cyclospora cayetanensis]